ncbi:ribosomal-protein-alanine N-acetyltransferase [Thermodesulfobacterium sp. TA1]|uniref:ribosomal protein S18-alanine N-acetyltransferase n=1 Tax=Thermodesulfobacterium sp. TA1 TaxID=2234087 RepID=UPI001231FE29|nr:ribosomal protein S18-alanine N-acetyltransferase [Thermodesulfobacterium sp. TA1]QER41966.1 ribosomal-protein-alanine N-acetyltransferase [Thermodesulfobacterium sp. TA1]
MSKIEELQQEEDLKFIAWLEKELFEEPWDYQTLWAEFKNPFSKIWILKHQEEKLGYLIFRQILDEAEILRIGIKKEHQKKGLGTFLLNEFLRYLKTNGLKKIHLELRVDNQPALKLYQKMGFQEVYLRKGYYQNTDALVMTKTL